MMNCVQPLRETRVHGKRAKMQGKLKNQGLFITYA